jgi:hypothetical protein
VVLSPTEAIQRAVVPAFQVEIPMMAVVPALQVEIPTAVATASSLHSNLDTAVGVDARSLDPRAARILLEAVVAMWEVHRLQVILPTKSRVPGYSKKPVT